MSVFNLWNFKQNIFQLIKYWYMKKKKERENVIQQAKETAI